VRGAVGAVVHATTGLLGLRLLAVGAVGRLDVDISDSAVLLIAMNSLVHTGRLREFGDDVPGMEEAGDVAEHAEEDVDEGVDAAESTFDPDRQRGEENGQKAKEDISRAHRD